MIQKSVYNYYDKKVIPYFKKIEKGLDFVY